MKAKKIYINRKTDITVFINQAVLVRRTTGQFSTCMWYPLRIVWGQHDKFRRGIYVRRLKTSGRRWVKGPFFISHSMIINYGVVIGRLVFQSQKSFWVRTKTTDPLANFIKSR
jgi:myo-inositol catabolism protein IolC